MARKRTAKTDDQEEFDVDEPSEVDEGANDSSSQNENSGAKGGRRSSTRTRTIKKPYRGGDSSGEDEEDDDDLESEEEKPKKKGGRAPAGGGRGRGRPSPASAKGKPPPKKQKKEEEEEPESEENEDSEDDEEGDGEESEGDAADTPAEFRSGCFVVLKSDIDNGEEDYPVWKIDGKSLLQKFDRFKNEEETLFKGTTIYAGWSKTVVDTYYPIKIEYKRVEGVDSAVKFDPSQIKKKDEADGVRVFQVLKLPIEDPGYGAVKHRCLPSSYQIINSHFPNGIR
ncbi:hypothetical protein GE061_003560 [Apolygus lucorum]|uniref:Uncharacterized protein n=1 Tax=Apolygus lucorum TaxID=248454 RepID=A0A8S9X3U3_APOLU|nr:hypothetical protein GE061_003560 [Apolygus lucorum]